MEEDYLVFGLGGASGEEKYWEVAYFERQLLEAYLKFFEGKLLISFDKPLGKGLEEKTKKLG